MSWAVLAVTSFAAGHVVVGALFSAIFLFGLGALYRLRPRYVEAARRAERLNREALERAGQPFREDPEAADPVRPSVQATAVGAVTLWVFYDLGFGALNDAIDGRSLDIGHVVARGALFATLMTLANLTINRRRTKRQARRPIA